MEGKYNRKVMIANKPIHSHNRGPNHILPMSVLRMERPMPYLWKAMNRTRMNPMIKQIWRRRGRREHREATPGIPA